MGHIFLLLTALVGITGCSTKMPLDAGRTSSSGLGIGVFVVTTDNAHTSVALRPTNLKVKSVNGNLEELYAFGDPVRELGDRSYQLVGSVELPPGKYFFTEFAGHTDLDFLAILPVRGQFYQSINREFELAAGEITYLGHLKATLVKRTDDSQERAGAIFPVADQARTGMSDGTIQFVFEDQFERDIRLLEESYPVLKEVKVRRAVIGNEATKPG